MASSPSMSSSIGIDTLVDHIQRSVKIPIRKKDAPFYFAIDHCFPIKGHGTVLTGTVLSGSVNVNSTIELPYIQQQRKVKSMQMFRKPVKTAVQGDRLGICVTNLDSTNIERSIAAAPGSIPRLHMAICMVKKVRYFNNKCKSSANYHISIGHTTMLATVTFYGAEELKKKLMKTTNVSTTKSHALSSSFIGSFPSLKYDVSDHYEVQSELVGEAVEVDGIPLDTDTPQMKEHAMLYGHEPVQYALVQFQQPVYCPIGGLIIGSRLDIDSKSIPSHDAKWEDLDETKNASKSCRLAFHGPVIEDFSRGKIEDIKLFTWRSKEAEVLKLTDLRDGKICYELIAHKLFSESGSVTPFLGMRLQTASNHVGIITGSYGAGAQFKVKFSSGVPRTCVYVGSKLILRFKRFVHDKTKRMCQFDRDFDHLVPDSTPGEVDMVEGEGEKARNGNVGGRSAGRGEISNKSTKIQTSKDKDRKTVNRKGIIESLKEDGELAIVSGAFSMEEDIRSHAGSQVHIVVEGVQKGVGVLIGPFAKLGKCKVRLEEKYDAALLGATVIITVQV